MKVFEKEFSHDCKYYVSSEDHVRAINVLREKKLWNGTFGINTNLPLCMTPLIDFISSEFPDLLEMMTDSSENDEAIDEATPRIEKFGVDLLGKVTLEFKMLTESIPRATKTMLDVSLDKIDNSDSLTLKSMKKTLDKIDSDMLEVKARGKGLMDTCTRLSNDVGFMHKNYRAPEVSSTEEEQLVRRLERLLQPMHDKLDALELLLNQVAGSGLESSGLESTIQHILDMGGGKCDRDTVVRALRAASNDPQRAIESLYPGTPASGLATDTPAAKVDQGVTQSGVPNSGGNDRSFSSQSLVRITAEVQDWLGRNEQLVDVKCLKRLPLRIFSTI